MINAKKKRKTIEWEAIEIKRYLLIVRKAMKIREEKGKGEKERYTHLNAEFQRKQGEIRK